MKMEKVDRKDAIEIIIKGEFTISDLQKFYNFYKQYSPNHTENIIFNLGDVHFIDSSAIGGLINIFRKIKDTDIGKNAYLYNVNKEIAPVFNITKLFRILAIIESPEINEKFPVT